MLFELLICLHVHDHSSGNPGKILQTRICSWTKNLQAKFIPADVCQATLMSHYARLEHLKAVLDPKSSPEVQLMDFVAWHGGMVGCNSGVFALTALTSWQTFWNKTINATKMAILWVFFCQISQKCQYHLQKYPSWKLYGQNLYKWSSASAISEPATEPSWAPAATIFLGSQ